MAEPVAEILPEDGTAGTLVGRVDTPAGPSVIAVRKDGVFDISGTVPTVADLCNAADPVALARAPGKRLGSLAELIPALLAPIDLQPIKAAGVTFAVSLLERLIEEHAKGDLSRAEQVRKELNSIIGADVTTIKPGSAEAEALKKTLMARGAWSPYLEVGIGPYAEIFTKGPPLSAVGYGAEIGIRSDSDWNNPEPEVTLIVNVRGSIVGATLGNDVNLRDMEGRSALLLGIAKDNNASCSIGPFVRLFDGTFTLDDVRKAKVDLEVTGPDQFRLRGSSDLSKISRDPADQEPLVRKEAQAICDRLGLGKIPDSAVKSVGGFWQPKYSIPNAKMVEAVQMVARTEGVLLDPVYTGKIMAGLMGLARQGFFKPKAKVLFMHTGGLPSLHVYEDVVLGRTPVAD